MAFYKSQHTGEQIDEAVSKVETLEAVEANADGDYTDYLRTLQIGDNIYLIPTYSTVSANDAEDAVHLLRNITVDGTEYYVAQPIYVEANPGEESGETLEKIMIGDVAYNIPQPIDVDGNVTGTPIGSLINIKIGSNIYSIPQPTTVAGNPTASGTTNLTKIQIGDTVYTILQPHTIFVNDDPLISTPTEDLYAIEIDGTCYSIPQPTTVAGNVEGDYTANLTSLQIGDKIYLIPTYSTVSANDAEDPVNILNNITINGTEYVLPQPTGTANRALFIDTTPYMSPFTSTWADWVANSAYNTDGYRVLDGYIAPQGDDTKVVMLGDVAVLPTDSVATKNYVVGDKPISTVTIPSGTYVGNDTIVFPSSNFVTIGIEFNSDDIAFSYMSVLGGAKHFVYQRADESGEFAYRGDSGADPLGWQNTAYKTITISTDQEVSPEFAEWFNGNYTEKVYTISAAHYIANSTITNPYTTFDFSFKFGTTSYTSIGRYQEENSYGTHDSYLRYGTTKVYLYESLNATADVINSNVWLGSYELIWVATTQTVSEEFYEWFFANYSKYNEGGSND